MIHFKDNGCPNWKSGHVETNSWDWKEFVKKAQEKPRSYCGLCIKHNTGSFYMRVLLFLHNATPFLVALLIIAVLAFLLLGLSAMIDREYDELIKECQSRKCATGSPTWMKREGKCLCVNLPE